MLKLDDVMVKEKRLIKGKNGYSEVIEVFRGYERFSKHRVTYTGLVNKLYEAYNSLEAIIVEVEKVVAVYMEGFCSKKVRFNCGDFHRQHFIHYFYHSRWIMVSLLSLSLHNEFTQFYSKKSCYFKYFYSTDPNFNISRVS